MGDVMSYCIFDTIWRKFEDCELARLRQDEVYTEKGILRLCSDDFMGERFRLVKFGNFHENHIPIDRSFRTPSNFNLLGVIAKKELTGTSARVTGRRRHFNPPAFSKKH